MEYIGYPRDHGLAAEMRLKTGLRDRANQLPLSIGDVLLPEDGQAGGGDVELGNVIVP